MNNLVYEKKNDIFTDSLIIADETQYQHESIVRTLNEYREKLLKFGPIKTSDFKSEVRGPGKTICLLNEPQATFLITLLRNNEKVVDFKARLVHEFYHMRIALMERQSTDWLKTREQGKLIRRDETDVIQRLIPYAENQGSQNANKFYMTYSKLVNKVVGVEPGTRESASHKDLMLIALLEDMVSKTIEEEMLKGVYYKEIYQICKGKAYQFAKLTYLKVS